MRPSEARSSGASGPKGAAGAAAGAAAAIVALGVAEGIRSLRATWEHPVVSVASWIVDRAPSWLKMFAIRTFGTADKPALLVGTTVLLIGFGVVIGVFACRRRTLGVAGISFLAMVGVGAAWSRPGASLDTAVPSVLSGLASLLTLLLLLHTVASGAAEGPMPERMARRRFLVFLGAAGAVAGTAGVLGRQAAKRFDIGAIRARIRLPSARDSAPAHPTGTELAVPGVTPFITPNRRFYRVDTALAVPQVDPERWRLRIRGSVRRPLTLTYRELLARPLTERDITLVCVSNEVGGPYAGTARWLGVRLDELLEEAGPDPAADQLVSRSVDGWTAGTPMAAVRDGRDALVAVGMNGEPLPARHGFPARLVVPGLYGYTSATKWLTELEVTTFAAYDAYWVRRGWARRAPIKTMTRIDTPRGLSRLRVGPVAIGGVAWAVHRGVDAVEVRIDDGPWRRARLGAVPSADTWRQWVLDWDAPPGRHTITARAVDGTGRVQTDRRAPPIPDGASGWHTIVVNVDP